MKINKLLIALISIFLSGYSYSSTENHETGEKLYKAYCVACHGASMGGMNMNNRVAPPMAAVRMHYINKYPDKKSFIQAISNWVGEQDEDKSLIPSAISRFKIMPPITVPKKDVEQIAAYIYSGNLPKPEGFDQMHRQNMMGMHRRGMGMQNNRNMGMHRQNMIGMQRQGMGMRNNRNMGMHRQNMMDMQNQGMGMRKNEKAMRNIIQQVDPASKEKQQDQ